MARRWIWLALALLLACPTARAVENSSTGTFNETAPDSNNDTDIPNWKTGWAQLQPTGTLTGWNYVGSVTAGSSAVYLGNGWFVTAGHVAANGGLNVTLNGTVYPYVSSSTVTLTTAVTTTTKSSTGTTTTTGGQADVTLFRVSPAPTLPALPIRTSSPVEGTSEVVMIGYGDGGVHTNKTWGYDLVDGSPNVALPLSSFVSNDFEVTNGANSEYELVDGDSGGADFIYNSSLSRWELAGINEAELENSSSAEVGSAFVQLNDSTFSTTYAGYPATGDMTTFTGTSTYSTQIMLLITPGTDTPAMPAWALLALGAVLFCVAMPAVIFERK